MLPVLFFVLLLLALVCFIAGALQVHTRRIDLLCVGAALWVSVPLIQTLQKLL